MYALCQLSGLEQSCIYHIRPRMGDKFEMRSSRGDSTEMITHCEGRIGRGLAEPATINLEERPWMFAIFFSAMLLLTI